MKIKQLRQRHPDYCGGTLEDVRALYEGGERFHERVKRFIPQNPQESDEAYDYRLGLVTYDNVLSGLIDDLVSPVFVTPPHVDEPSGPEWDRWTSNTDQTGTDLGAFAAEMLRDALLYRCCYVWVNLPASSQAEYPDRAAQEQAGALDVYAVRFSPAQVIDWGEDAAGNLAWLLVEDQTDERAGPAAARVTTWRWTHIDARAITRWTWTSTDGLTEPPDDAEAEGGEKLVHGYAVFPVLRLKLPTGLWAGRKLHDPALAHVRDDNDLRFSLHQAAHPLLVIGSDKPIAKPVLGPGRYLKVGAEDKVEFAEPGGAAYAFGIQQRDASRDAMYRSLRQMAKSVTANSSQRASSGDSKAMDWRATEILLDAYADQIREALRSLVRMISIVLASEVDAEKVKISGMNGYTVDDIAGWLSSSALATEARQFSSTFRRELARREVELLLPDVDDATRTQMLKEIDAADVETEMAAAKAAKAALASIGE